MKKYLMFSFLMMGVLSTFSVVAQEQQQEQDVITQNDVVGIWEGVLVDPSGEFRNHLGTKEYIVSIALFKEGTLYYREFHNSDRTKGILGTPEKPGCPGTYTINANAILTTTDCSRYTKVYNQKIVLDLASIEKLKAGESATLTVTTSLVPMPLQFTFQKY